VRPSRHRYGDHKSQVGDLWLADGGTRPDSDCVPVVVLIHGGYWRSMFTRSLMNRLARAVVARGWAAWNIEYRRTGALGGGGGWPTTFTDVGAALDYVTRLAGVDAQRVITCGHSAGGCLALWAATRGGVASDPSGDTPVVRPIAAISLAGVVDLVRGAELGLGGGAVTRFMGGSFEEHPDRYRSSSPAELLPLGIRQVLVHGLSDTVVPPSMSRDYQRVASEAGDDARYVPLDGVDHRGLIDPGGPAWPVIAGHIEELLSS
jgi:acetyl esterase/lipase